MYLKSLPQVLVYHTRDLKNSLENIELQSYTDVMVMLGINDVKRPGMKEWQVKKVREKIVIQSYMLTCSRLVDLKTSSTFYTSTFC